MSLGPDDIVICSPRVLSQILDGEAVILDLASGTYFGLDDVSTAIWQLVTTDAGTTVGAIRRRMLAEFDVTEEVLDRDLASFLQTLEERGLVTLSSPPP